MIKKRAAAMFTAAALAVSLLPITAGATPQIEELGYTDITADISPTVIGTYDMDGDWETLFDGDVDSGVVINRKTEPYLGGFVLDAGEGKTFAEVNAIDFTCVNGDDLYIFASNDNIQEAIAQSGSNDLCGNGNNYANFNSEELGIEVELISTAEVGWYQDSDKVYWGRNIVNRLDYRYLYIGSPRWQTDTTLKEMKLMHAPAGWVEAETQENCTVSYTEGFEVGNEVTITVTPEAGYEVSKLNVDGETVELSQTGDGTAEYTVTDAPVRIIVDAWADPIDGKLDMTEIAEAPADLPNSYVSMPSEWSDNDILTSGDLAAAPGMTVFDAGEGNRYALERVIAYARKDMPGRAHFRLFGTNSELTADMFTAGAGASGSLELSELTHDGDGAFGTGSWSDNSGGGKDAARGDYEIDGSRGYRYIILQSDNQNMLSLGELKFYGTVRTADQEPEPEQGTVSVGTQSRCTVSYTEPFNEGGTVTITVTANDGYEFAKLNLNGRTVDAEVAEDGKSASYTVENAPKTISVNAWADPEGKLEMNELKEKPADLTTVASYGTMPEEWSDNNLTTSGDFLAYPGMVIFDAGEEHKYALSRIVAYANADRPDRAHFKVYGTNEPLTAEMFTAADGANSSSPLLQSITHDGGEAFYGTGSWDGDNGGSGDAERGNHEIDGVKSYRYIILQSDHNTMLSLSELKFYGTLRGKDEPDPDPTSDERLKTYPIPSGVEISGTYKVKARPVGSDDSSWQDIGVHRVQVMSNGTRQAGMVYFDCTGPTEVKVICTGGGDGIDNIENGLNAETKVYPESYGIDLDYEIGGNIITLVVEPGQRVVLDPNGDTRRNIHIWADYPIDIPTEDEIKAAGETVTVVDAAKGDVIDTSYNTDVVYVKQGFYANGNAWRQMFVKSNQTWYFEPGAVINGQLVLDNTINAKLIGHGLIYRPGHASMNINETKNVYIEGVMGLNHGWGDNGGYFLNVANSKNVYVKNLKSIGRHKWGDTMDIFCSEDVTVEGCYFRGNDDCIAIYGPRWNGDHWGDTGNVRNIKVRNCVLMPDLARPIHFATHGDSSSPNGGRVIDNCSFEDIDILTYNKYAFKNDGSSMPQAIRMDVSEGNTVTNIYFDDIRIQDGAANKICELFITTQDRYGTWTYPGKGINNVYFKDIDYKNSSAFDGRVEGYSTSDGVEGMTQNVTFENLKINGEVALSAEDANIRIGNNTKNINFVASGGSSYVYDPNVVPEDIWPEFYDYARVEGASASAEVSEDGSNPSYAIDGDESTVWYSALSDTNPVYNWEDNSLTGDGITVDLGAQRHIKGVRITWEDPAPTHAYRIYVSKDGTDWSAGHTDEHGVGAVNDKAAAEFNKRVKTTWFANQHDPEMGQDHIIGQYVKIIPLSGTRLDIASLEILGDAEP